MGIVNLGVKVLMGLQHASDPEIGVAVIDGFTHYVLNVMETVNSTSELTMAELFATFDPEKIHSHPGVRSDLFSRKLEETRVIDFFGGRTGIEGDEEVEDIPPNEGNEEESTEEDIPAARSRTPRSPEARPGSPRTLRTWTGVAVIGLLIGWSINRGRNLAQ